MWTVASFIMAFYQRSIDKEAKRADCYILLSILLLIFTGVLPYVDTGPLEIQYAAELEFATAKVLPAGL